MSRVREGEAHGQRTLGNLSIPPIMVRAQGATPRTEKGRCSSSPQYQSNSRWGWYTLAAVLPRLPPVAGPWGPHATPRPPSPQKPGRWAPGLGEQGHLAPPLVRHNDTAPRRCTRLLATKGCPVRPQGAQGLAGTAKQPYAQTPRHSQAPVGRQAQPSRGPPGPAGRQGPGQVRAQ